MKKYALLACASHILFFSNEVEAGKTGRQRAFLPVFEMQRTSSVLSRAYPRNFANVRFSSSKKDKELDEFARELRDSIEKDLNSSGKASIKACFLGPRAENFELLGDLVNEAIRDHAYWRRNFYPKDPARITEEMKRSPSFLETEDNLRKYFRYLLADLKRSLPTSSPRYQGHMNWEVSLPSTLGYIAAMLYNQNNVSFEGSPVTTILEEQVGKDLCQMIGYTVLSNKDNHKAKIPSWGHLTCDGTVANIEALWSARNAKFYPLAVKWALEHDDALKEAHDITVKLPTGEIKKLLSLDEWSLLNIESDEALALPERIYELLGKPKSMPLDALYQRLARFSIQKMGIKNTYDRLVSHISTPVFMVTGTRHYSFPKAVSLLGLGDDHLLDIPVDKDTRMDLEKLEEALQRCSKERRPVITVSAIMGTTEESSVDPLAGILDKREKLRSQQCFDFTVHADAAWGGYFSSLLRGEEKGEEGSRIAVPVIYLSDYVKEQFEWLRFADSVTIDPHKTGYAPYPAGALCYRNDAMKTMVNFTAPVIQGKDKEVPIIGIYGVEGSKPGASAASVFLSHRVIPLTDQGHGKLLGQTLFGAKLLYGKLLTMEEKDFFVVPLSRLPSAKQSPQLDNGDEIKKIKQILTLLNEEIRKDKKIQSFLREIGPDLNIVSYAFNFNINGVKNTSLVKANKFNELIFDRLKPRYKQDIHRYNLLVSQSSLSRDLYGPLFLEDFMKRLGVENDTPEENYSLNLIRSVVMSPWVTDTEKGSALGLVMDELQQAVRDAYEEIQREVPGV